MRIQNINQNNYPKRNVGFKMQNANIVIEGLNCAFGDLCGPSKQIVIDRIIPELVNAKLVGVGDTIHLISIQLVESSKKDLRVLAVDNATNDEVKLAQSLTERDSILNMVAMQSKPITLTVKKIFPWLQGDMRYTSLNNPLKI